MRIIIAIALAASVLTPVQAFAQKERAGSAAIGAVSGALVLGPVGLVAGAVIGYTAGPEIGRSLRGSRAQPRPQARAARRYKQMAARQRALTTSPASNAEPGVVTPQRPAPGVGGPAAQGFE